MESNILKRIKIESQAKARNFGSTCPIIEFRVGEEEKTYRQISIHQTQQFIQSHLPTLSRDVISPLDRTMRPSALRASRST